MIGEDVQIESAGVTGGFVHKPFNTRLVHGPTEGLRADGLRVGQVPRAEHFQRIRAEHCEALGAVNFDDVAQGEINADLHPRREPSAVSGSNFGGHAVVVKGSVKRFKPAVLRGESRSGFSAADGGEWFSDELESDRTKNRP